MVLQGYVNYPGDGLIVSTKAMVTQISLMNIHTDNIANFGIPGYQTKQPVVTSFVEYLGTNGIDKVTDTSIGRLRKSDMPLDFALNCKGYFQKLNAAGGVELTRDGRFKLDKNGYVCALDNKKILSNTGEPLRITMRPESLETDVKVTANGEIQVFDRPNQAYVAMGKIGVALENGSAASTVDIKQGYVEDSNVMLQNEFVAVMPLRRQFEANRQMFIMQSDALSRMIQELGRNQ